MKGVWFLLASQIFLVSMDAVGKKLSSQYPVIFLIWARYFVLLGLLLAFSTSGSRFDVLRTKHLLLHLVRATLLVGTSLLGLLALEILPLGDTAGLAFIAPLMIVLLAKFFFADVVTLVQWVCVLVGTAGVVIIGQLGGSVNWPAGALVLGAAFCFSLYQIATKKLRSTENHISLLIYPALLATIFLGIFIFLGQDKIPYNKSDLIWILSLGILSGAGHYFANIALSCSSLSRLAPFMYFQLIWAILIGWIYFGEFPDFWVFFGMTLIVCSGLISAREINSRSKLQLKG